MEQKEITLDAASIFNAVPGNYLVLLPNAPTFTIVGVTESFLKATFTHRANIIGQPLFSVFPDNPGQTDATGVTNLLASLQYVLQHKKEHRMNDQRYDVFNPQQGRFELKIWRPYNKPVFDSQNNIQYIINWVEDVTEKVLLKEKTKEISTHQHKLLYSLFMQAPVAIAIFKGAKFVIELANDAHLKIWGRTAEEVIGKPVFEALPEVKGQGYEQLLNGVLTTGKPFYAQELFADLKRDGKQERVYFNFVYHPLKDLDGSITGIIVVANEVTEQVLIRKKVEESEAALIKTNAELTRTNANLEEFAYAASHDLKEPIRKIFVFADRLKQVLSDRMTEEEVNYFHRMERAAIRMRSLIDDLLLYSHVSRGASAFEDIDLNLKVQKVLEDLELEVQEKGATIVVDALPVIKGYRRQLQQLFQNLISNALKYHKKNVVPHIHISCSKVTGAATPLNLTTEEKEKQYYLIEVADNGIGFEQEDAERIFNVFTRLYGNMEYKGTGVGLAIARKVVENHNGFIWATGKPGVGAIFHVLLPG